jgi:hypothetical protein
MEDNTIYLYEQDDMYAKLSPDYNSPFLLDKEESSNIIAYSYAGILRKNRNGILQSMSHSSLRLSTKYLEEEQDDTFKSTLLKGLDTTFNQIDPMAKMSLLNTGNAVIKFKGPTDYREHDVVISECLTKLRKVYQKEFLQNVERDIDDAKFIEIMSKVYNALQIKILSTSDDLSLFLGKSPEEIAQELKISSSLDGMTDERKREIATTMLPSLDSFMSFLPQEDRQRLSIIKLLKKYSLNIAYVLRMMHRQTYMKSYEEMLRNELVESYIKNYTEDSDIRKEFLKTLSPELIEELKDRLLYLFKNSKDVVPLQSLKLPKPFVDIKGTFVIYHNEKYPKEMVDRIFDPSTFTKEFDVMYDMNLSPFQIRFFEIDNFFYPSAIFYAYSMMIENLNYIRESELVKHTKMSVHLLCDKECDPQEQNLLLNFVCIRRLYMREENDHIRDTVSYRARKALFKKFQNDEMAALLVHTGTKNLVYNNPNDRILGSRFAQDKIGSIMMDIRAKIEKDDNRMKNISPLLVRITSLKENPKVVQTLDDLLSVVFRKKLDFTSFKLWIFGQLRDIMTLLIYLKKYSSVKTGKNDKRIVSDDIFFIIEKIYSVCYGLESLIDVDKFNKLSSVPLEIEQMIKEFFDHSEYHINRKDFSKLWNYLLILILSIEELGQFNIETFEQEIKTVSDEKYNETKTNCKSTLHNIDMLLKIKERELKEGLVLPELSKDDINKKMKENCIAQAYMNLIDKVKSFYESNNDSQFTLENSDLNFIYNIITHYLKNEVDYTEGSKSPVRGVPISYAPVPPSDSEDEDDFKYGMSRLAPVKRKGAFPNLVRTEVRDKDDKDKDKTSQYQSQNSQAISRILSGQKIKVKNDKVVDHFSRLISRLSEESDETLKRVIYFSEQNVNPVFSNGTDDVTQINEDFKIELKDYKKMAKIDKRIEMERQREREKDNVRVDED